MRRDITAMVNEKYIQNFGRKTKEENHSVNLRVCGEILLNWILRDDGGGGGRKWIH
jgi:hypothetical protein